MPSKFWNRCTRPLRAAVAGLLIATAASAYGDVAQLAESFNHPPDDARIMTRWWWFGPAVTKPMIEKDMQTMKAGGFGGFEVQPTYPLSVDGSLPGVHNIKFLSPEFMDMLNFTAAKAKELGLRMNLTLGSGWPYGGPMFTRSEAAGEIFEQVARAAGGASVKVPRRLSDGQTLIAAFAFPPGKEVPIVDNAAQIPAGMTGPVEVHFYIAGRTGMQVKRAAFGAEGNVIDHLSEPVVKKFIEQVAEPEIAACGENPPYSIFCDSLEVARESWTDDFLAEFQKRRGYDLRPLLPALFDDNFPRALDIRHDWGKTLTECFNDNFNKAFQGLARIHNTKFREQAYGSPSAGQFSYADVDLPEGEGFLWHQYAATRYASSATHLLGVPVSSSETFTWLHSPVFRATPLDMKAEADLHFLQGVNQIICHGWPSTPPGVSYPGWSFYAAAVFNDKNPWWIVMPDVTKYLQRVSHLMRQGSPTNDVALYLADSDAWAHFTPEDISLTSMTGRYLGTSVGTILDAGYNLDLFDDGMLQLRGKVDGGALAFGDLKYKVIVLSGVQRIPVTTMRTLEQFSKNGGTVVAFYNLPSLAPGYLATDADTKEVADIARRLFTDPGAKGILIKSDDQFAAALAGRLVPDVKLSPAAPEVGFVHRHTDDAEIYFVANTSNREKKLNATFRVQGLQPEIWDAMTGRTNPATALDQSSGGESVALDLSPYGSTVIVWTHRAAAPSKAAPVDVPPVDLSGHWTVTFGDSGPKLEMETLRSWTVDAATRNFSGVATYQRSVTIPSGMVKPGVEALMTFGPATPLPSSGRGRMQAYINSPVREAAVVYINGTRVGSVWHPPYTLDLSGTLKEGANDVRIEVANLAINSMAGHGFPNYDVRAIRGQFGNRFDPQDVQNLAPLPAGLMGPIQIVAGISR